VDDYLSVAPCPKDVTEAFQFSAQFLEVIDFAVENYPRRVFLIRHRLMATLKINDR
jgi:hypothetical protein